MAHIIGDIAVIPKMTGKTQKLSCMRETTEKFCKKDIYNAEAIQQRIDDAAKARARLDTEVKQRYENIKHINFIG